MEKITAKITTAKAAGFAFAFIAEMDWSDVATLRQTYEVVQGWNNKHLTGYVGMEFGYLIKF
jgi:hypothetical protein